MRIIAKSTLRKYWERHPKTESPLRFWHGVVEDADWERPQDVRNTFRTADPIGPELVVFDICNNDYRLLVNVDYRRGIVYIQGIFTHAEYDRLDLSIFRRDRKGPHRY